MDTVEGGGSRGLFRTVSEIHLQSASPATWLGAQEHPDSHWTP
jgi:hypothetical protein